MAWVEMFQKDQMDMTPEEWRIFWDTVHGPELRTIQTICEKIGYGRVIQYVEELISVRMPGWIEARNSLIKEGKAY